MKQVVRHSSATRICSLIILAMALLAIQCTREPKFDKAVIIGKEHNIKPTNWACPSESLTVIKNTRTLERIRECGNLGAIGDTIGLKRESFP